MSNARKLANLLGGGAFNSVGIDDNADTTTLTLDTNEDVTVGNGVYVSGDLTSLTVDKGGIDRSGNTTRIISGRSGGNYADFSVNIAGVGGVNRQLYMDYQGNMTLDNGNLVIGTSGKGIDFSATANSSGSMSNELLDDYEEGTWTPTLPNGGNVNDITNARYTKVGAMVYAGAYIHVDSIPNNNSGCDIGGLPYAVAGSSMYHGAGAVTYVHTFNWNGTGAIGGGPTPYSGQSQVYFHRGDGSSATVKNSALTSLQQFIFGIVYISDV